MVVTCDCGQRMEVADGSVGATVVCENCGREVLILGALDVKVAARKARKRWALLVVSAVACSLVGVVILAAVFGLPDMRKRASNKSRRGGAANTQEDVRVVEKSIGDFVVAGKIRFAVQSVREFPALEGTYGTIAAGAEKMFVVVRMTVANTADTSVVLAPDSVFWLFDEHREQYDTHERSVMALRDCLNAVKLEPGRPRSGTLLYEVPDDLQEYWLAAGVPEEYLVYKIRLTH